MPTLRDAAIGYVPKQIKTVADLPQVPVDAEILDNSEAEFPYKFIVVKDEEYKVPDSVQSEETRRRTKDPLHSHPNKITF